MAGSSPAMTIKVVIEPDWMPGEAVGAALSAPVASPPQAALDTASRPLYLADRLFNRMVEYVMSPDPLSTTLAALADPTRRAILARLAIGEATVGELAEPFPMSPPGISKHP